MYRIFVATFFASAIIAAPLITENVRRAEVSAEKFDLLKGPMDRRGELYGATTARFGDVDSVEMRHASEKRGELYGATTARFGDVDSVEMRHASEKRGELYGATTARFGDVDSVEMRHASEKH